MRVYFITSNMGKYEEVNEILAPIPIIQKKVGYPEIQTSSLEEVIRFGMDALKAITLAPVMIEDSGLFIDAFGRFPGVYSAYVYESIGNQGILKLMKNIRNRQAVFRSVIGYRDSDNEVTLFQGLCKGTISKRAQGLEGFGFDPIFVPEGSSRTFAQMEKREKNRYSHRGKSVHKLKKFLEKKGNHIK